MNTLVALIIVGGLTIPAWIAISIYQDHGSHRRDAGQSAWEIIARVEKEKTGYVITATAPSVWERGGYRPMHSPEVIPYPKRIMMRPRQQGAGTRFTTVPPLAITAG